MKLFWAALVVVPLFAADVPNRYIVELSTEPVAVRVRAQGRLAIHSLPAEQHRQRIRAEQTAARSRIQQAEGRVTGALENLHNALVVRIDDSKASRLAGLPGVLRVYRVRTLHLMLDHALPLHHVPDAWTQVGIGNAGAGVRIAFIDSGVDIGHPGFQDAGFTRARRVSARRPELHEQQSDRGAQLRGDAAERRSRPLARATMSGHGTATAMAAAGVQNTGPLAIVSGVAPRAYIGSYKVFGTPAAKRRRRPRTPCCAPSTTRWRTAWTSSI